MAQNTLDDQIIETKIIVTILHQGNPYAEGGYSLSDIQNNIDEGEDIGQFEVVTQEKVAADEVAHRLVALNNDGTFFDTEDACYSDLSTRWTTHTRIVDVVANQGWNVDTRLTMAEGFLKKIGMFDAYADHLEITAEKENEASARLGY